MVFCKSIQLHMSLLLSFPETFICHYQFRRDACLAFLENLMWLSVKRIFSVIVGENFDPIHLSSTILLELTTRAYSYSENKNLP